MRRLTIDDPVPTSIIARHGLWRRPADILPVQGGAPVALHLAEVADTPATVLPLLLPGAGADPVAPRADGRARAIPKP